MDQYFKLLLLFLAVNTTDAGKYIYGPTYETWLKAQEFCRTHHTDLAPTDSTYDMSLIQKLQSSLGVWTWIGLIKSSNSSTGWKWSGGADMDLDKHFWAPGEPDNTNGIEEHVVLKTSTGTFSYMWWDFSYYYKFGFLCYKVHAVRERKTWYEALDYCRSHHQDLASVASVTEMMLMQREVSKKLSSYNVWIGLHFLDGGWVWMDGQPFTFESWVANQKPACPDMHLSCGALRFVGPMHETERLANVTGVKGWNSFDCSQKLHFLCY
ncbi:unnamed protein product [Knipowitschia caucasica]